MSRAEQHAEQIHRQAFDEWYAAEGHYYASGTEDDSYKAYVAGIAWQQGQFVKALTEVRDEMRSDVWEEINDGY